MNALSDVGIAPSVLVPIDSISHFASRQDIVHVKALFLEVWISELD
jgi:hypothetical protein